MDSVCTKSEFQYTLHLMITEDRGPHVLSIQHCSQCLTIKVKQYNFQIKAISRGGGGIKGICKGCVPHTEQLFPRVSDSNRLRLCRIQIRVSNNTGTVEIGLADRKAFLGFLSSKLQVVFANRETNGLGTKSGTSCCLIIQCSLLYTFARVPCPFLEESKENLC